MRIFKILFVALVAVAFFSCSKPSYNKEYSWAYPVAGDWTVKAYVDGVQKAGPLEIKSYNSSMGKDSVWFDDYGSSAFNTTTNKWTITQGHFWTMKFKTAVDMTNKTFSTTGSTNAIGGYRINIKVSDGKIIGKDSITMNVVFEDEPAITYRLAGHRTVSYEEYTQQ
jgi:hypothetical protein